MKKLIALLLVLVMALGIFAACADTKIISEDEAKQIALKNAGLTLEEVGEVHAHSSDLGETVAYSIYFSYEGKDYSYTIDGKTGVIISKGNEGHAH